MKQTCLLVLWGSLAASSTTAHQFQPQDLDDLAYMPENPVSRVALQTLHSAHAPAPMAVKIRQNGAAGGPCFWVSTLHSRPDGLLEGYVLTPAFSAQLKVRQKVIFETTDIVAIVDLRHLPLATQRSASGQWFGITRRHATGPR